MQPAHLIRTANNGQPASLLKGVVFAPVRGTGDKLLPGNGLSKSSQDTKCAGSWRPLWNEAVSRATGFHG